jgi:endonuclease YncB( thermonuclease family)
MLPRPTRIAPRDPARLLALLLALAVGGCLKLPTEPPPDLGPRPAELRRDVDDPPDTDRHAEVFRVPEPAPAPAPAPAAPAEAAPQAQAVEAFAGAPSRDTPAALIVGHFPLSQDRPIIDGDTIRVEGLDATLRLLSIDTEEHYRSEADRREAELDFDAYVRARQEGRAEPGSYGTPMGIEATRFAERFFEGHTFVLLEYDHENRRRGYYGRHLVYVFVLKDGAWVNYNVEAVRAGMSPYYMKYGYSTRFHDAFVAAEEEAREQRRGIWAAGAKAYPDYDVRIALWRHRADTLARFHENHGDNPRFVDVGADGAMERLLALEGEVVTIFGAVGRERERDEPPFIVPIQHRRGNDFAIVAFERPDLDRLNLHRFAGEYAYLRGRLTTYRGRPQILARNVERVWTE